MLKYLLIGKKIPIGNTASCEISKRFKNDYIKYCDYIDDNKIDNLQYINEKYRKLIFMFHSTNNYKNKLNIINLSKLKYLLYTRCFNMARLTNSATNGFSIFNGIKCHKHFIPLIPKIKIENKNVDECIGFSIRQTTTLDTYYYFLDWLKNNKKKINLYIMGGNTIDFKKFKCVNKFTYTNNNIEFFENITHFIFPQSVTYIDPFPHTLMEAFQCNKQIIAPKIGIKNHKDGVDDILEMFNYHTTFNFNKNITNNLNFNFDNYYKKILDNNFDNYLEYNKYKTFYEWCSNEL